MNYPTMEEVDSADRVQLATWKRFLRSPGWNAVGQNDFEELLKHERPILDKICERFDELGGMTPTISKHIGWK